MRTSRRRVATILAVGLALVLPLGILAPRASAASLPAPQSGAEVFLRPASGGYDLVGGGFGHGVGMSQYGAHGAALKGLTHAQILAFYYPGTTLAKSAPTTIRVGITSDNDGVVQVGARAGLALQVGSTKKTLPATPTQWRVKATSTAAKSCVVESLTGSTWSVYEKDKTPCPVTFSNPAAGPDKDTLDVYLPSGERRVYRGTITAHHRGTTSLATVNTVPMQHYLRGVVPSEMPTGWHAEALKAQAVAARTFAARSSNGTSYYDTCDTTSCQVYKGRGKRNANDTISSYEYAATNAAIDATNGQVLTYRFSDGVTRLATTMYSSSNGGQTVAGGAGHGYLVAKKDPYDAVTINKRHAWTATLPVASLESRFGINRLERVQILSRDRAGQWGGRVLQVRVEGFTASGAYRSVDTTGNGLLAARPWPANSTGLSSNYFSILVPTTAAPAPTTAAPAPTTAAPAPTTAAPAPTTAAPAPARAPARPAGTVTRVATGTIYTVTAKFAKDNWKAGVPVVYVANGSSYSDQLVTSARAAYNGGPLLLTTATSLPSQTRDAMVRLKPGRVVVIGGTKSISAKVAEQLRLLTSKRSLERVAGASKYDTAARLASYWPSGVAVAYVAAGDSYGDAASGAALAGRDRAPVLITAKGSLPAATKTALKRLKPRRIVVLGGTHTVSAAVATALKPYATSRSVTRLGGADRYASSAVVGAQYASTSRAYVTTGKIIQHAYAAAALAGKNRWPVLVTAQSSLSSGVRRQVERLRPSRTEVLGSTTYVSEVVMGQLRQAVR
jgi:SpoIID/LytB domain protein